MQPGDIVSLLIGPRDGNHSCDLTAVDLKLSTRGNGEAATPTRKGLGPGPGRVAATCWPANPHADRFGNAGVWHFYTEPERAATNDAAIPAGSLLAKWQIAGSASERSRLAGEVQKLLASGPPADAKTVPTAFCIGS